MRRIALAAAFTALVGVIPAHSSVLALPFNCTTGTTCSTAATTIPISQYSDTAGVRTIGCDWTASTAIRVEVIVTAANGTTAVNKVYFPVQANEKAGRALTTARFDKMLYADYLRLEAGQLLKVTVVTSNSGINKGICYIDVNP